MNVNHTLIDHNLQDSYKLNKKTVFNAWCGWRSVYFV